MKHNIYYETLSIVYSGTGSFPHNGNKWFNHATTKAGRVSRNSESPCGNRPVSRIAPPVPKDTDDE